MVTKIGVAEIEDMALGATVLGAGGGGDPYVGKLMVIEAIRRYGEIDMISADEVPDDQIVAISSMMGAPTIMVEKICKGDEPMRAYDAFVQELGVEIPAVLAMEAGGLNSMIPFILGATRHMPVIDADTMGRAFPEMQMTTFSLHGIHGTPMVMCDEKGNQVSIHSIDDFWFERLSRNTTSMMGGYSILCSYSCTGAQMKKYAIKGTLSQCMNIGRAIRESKANHMNGIDAVLQATNGFRLFHGKCVDCERKTDGMFVRGQAVIDGLEEDKGSQLVLKFQNENIIALKDGVPIATAPDIICSLDVETGRPITTEGMKYGARLYVVGLPCDPQWRTEEGLDRVGPRYFKYDVDYIPIEERVRMLRDSAVEKGAEA